LLPRVTRIALFALVAVVVAACTTASGVPVADSPRDQRIYVTSNDWHTRLVVATDDLPVGLLPERADLAPAGWLAIGWGDQAYYPMPDPPRRLALKAAFLPSASVVHLIPMAAPPRSFAGFEVLEIRVSGEGLGAMLAAIDAEFERQGQARAPIAAPGLYPESLFYPATGTFHIFNTCNRWVARKLQTAGVPIRAFGVITAEDLMRQLRPLAEASVPGG
jgi:uncharacterized protein (TIGR02117 family)